MKTKYVATGICGLAFIVLFNALLIHRDRQLYKVYNACQQFTHHPDCPDSWKAKPAFSRP